jgi:hypothetical protein
VTNRARSGLHVEVAHSGALLMETHGTNWFNVALKFTASTPTVLFMAGDFGGNGRIPCLEQNFRLCPLSAGHPV